MTRVRCLIVASLIGLTAGCGDDTTTIPTPTPPNIFTEVFTGTVSQNGATTHVFVSQGSGLVTASLTSIAPDTAQIVGLSLGTMNNSSCQIVIANDKATLSVPIQGSVGLSGLLCARVYDVGTISSGSPVTYELTVLHP